MPLAWTDDDLADNPHTHTHKADKVRHMFAAIARSYDLNNTIHSFGRDAAWRRTAVRLAALSPGDHVLDVACGTGALTRAFAAAKVRPGRVIGVDFTDEMLAVARRSSTPDVEYILADAMQLPFPDASFDVVSIAFGIRNVVDPVRALREFRRVLGPTGRLVILEFGRPKIRPISWLNDLYTRRLMPATASLIARDRSGAYRYLPRSVASFATPGELGRMIVTAGFSEPIQHPMTMGVCVAHVARPRVG